MGRIIFVISVVLLITLFNLLKRNDRQLNILTSIILSIIIFFAFNAFIIFILSIFNIRATLLIRIIINLMLSIFFIYKLKNTDKRQQYYFNYFDIVAVIVLLFFTICIYNYRFKNDNLIFESMDPSAHFFLAEQFKESSTLSKNVNGESIYSSNKTYDLFGSYTVVGTIFQVIGNDLRVDDVYVFIGFEMGVYLLSGLFLYFSIIKKDTRNYKRVIMLCLVISYLLGYPLNNLVFGFHYLGLSILLINTILYLFDEYNKSAKPNKIIYYICLFLLNFNLFYMYYLFVPIIYGALGLYFLYKCFVEKKAKFKEVLKEIVITLVIPFIIGIVMYFIYPRFISNSISGTDIFELDGYIYRSLLGNFIIYIPFILYMLINAIRNKKLNVTHFVYPFIIIFMIYTFYNIYYGNYATYYYFKFYYLLAFFVTLSIGKEVENNKFDMYSYLVIYIFILSLLQFFQVERNITRKVYLLNPTDSISAVNDVIRYNQVCVEEKNAIFTKKQLNDLKDLIDKFKTYNVTSSNTVSNFGTLQKLWIYSLSDVSVAQEPNDFESMNKKVDYFKLLSDKENKYFLSFTGIKLEDLISDRYTLLYANDSFLLYEKVS
ncbi:MAG: hypothetical protein IJ068_02930 [Bacilli bacterium]|nr:hypothetical protein [Bacilli bacterium]